MDDISQVDVPAVVVSIDHQISEGRIIRFQTGIAKDAPAAEFDALLDKLTTATDRQAAKYKIETLQAQLAEEEKLYIMRQEDLTRIDAEAQAEYERKGDRRAPWSPDKLPANKLAERKNADIFISRLRDNIKSKRSDLATLTKLVGGHANGGATRSEGMSHSAGSGVSN
jgi:hypothetical protein